MTQRHRAIDVTKVMYKPEGLVHGVWRLVQVVHDGPQQERSVSEMVEPADLAAFLRDVVESTTRQQRTVSDQTRDGFVVWCADVVALEGVGSPYLEQPHSATNTFLVVPRPGREPARPATLPDGTVDEDAMRRYNEQLARWQQHKQLYDQLFAARTPPDGMELVVATGLLVSSTESGELRRHLAVAPAEAHLDRNTGVLRVEMSDAAIQEINWTLGEIRQRLVEDDAGLSQLVEAQSLSEADTAIRRIIASFGSDGRLLDRPTDPARPGSVAVGACPAVLLRRRDTSALLDLLRTMSDDMKAGGFVSDPFRMIVSPDYSPPRRDVQNDRAALPLPANNEQRSMIDRARSEAHMVIQGPPGTGKTHTIANLAAVLMAEGRRVLITAENERALREVQSKLPAPMRPLMLPMLRERGTGALQASVNELNTRAGGSTTKEDREQEIEEWLDRLLDIERQIEKAESRLAEVAQADRADRTFGRTTMRVSGHQQALAGERARLELVDRYLDPVAPASAADARTILELTPIVDAQHEQMRRFHFPEDLMSPGDLAMWLQEHRGQLAVLGDPTDFDHSSLVDRVDDLVRLATVLQTLPPTPWSAIARTPEEYLIPADECVAVARSVDHGVTVEPHAGRAAAVGVLEAYLALDPGRFDQPLHDLLEQHARARAHVDASTHVGEFRQHQRADELTRVCESALDLLSRDRSGVLSDHVADHRSHGRSAIDALVVEAESLLPGARAPLGLPVQVADGAPPAHELLKQAEGLLAHLKDGGKLTKLIGTPRAVKEAADLLAYVRVNGSPIDTIEEAARAVEYFRHQTTVALIDAWASQHGLRIPQGVPHHEWLTAITGLPAASQQVREALSLVDELVKFPFGSAPEAPADLLRAALATISQEVVSALDGLASAATAANVDVRIDGVTIRSRADAERAVASLRACELRERHHRLLPPSWAERCNPVDVDDDMLVQMLHVCAAAAAVPGRARSADLTPSAVNRIAERAQIDARRNQLREDHDRVIGGLRRKLAACVPMSPATRAIDDALASERPDEYRVAVEELGREREMADRAIRLERARARVAEAHPTLLAAFDTGDPDAARTLESLEELQELRDYRATVARWKDEIGSSEEIHQELARLHDEHRRAEEEVAALRCWSKAIDRLQSDRRLRSALSALTIAMDRVPKTTTAKSYPALMRALRDATKRAAPAIPCWVMSIDRVAEVLGYPRGEDRFDVVIVDEASQAWFPAAFLYAIADQVIIVGDDLQTSPTMVAVNESEIRSIAKEHIAGHRLANQVGADLSLYDVAAIMTGPETMVDHFRCVPEIIDISNRLSYEPKGKKLLASRVREPGSLEPIKHVQVRGARVGQTGANDAEVKAIVEQVARCHADPAYAGMDFGVVVVGTSPNAHLKALMAKLLDELGPTAIEQRNLEVGTPSQFQGAERNVMFLSLLDVPQDGERLRRWPHEHTGANRQRVQQLNVAVSRAKDQLWIFRSFDLSALAPDDARAIILQSATPDVPSIDAELRKCQSDFERDVVRALAAADPTLTIRTQIEAIGYQIDVVLEDEFGHRLAVECDGDRWHTAPDRVKADLYRQRTLEKIGWRFHRFLASEWYENPDRRVDMILEHFRSLPRARTAPTSGGNASSGEAEHDVDAEDRPAADDDRVYHGRLFSEPDDRWDVDDLAEHEAETSGTESRDWLSDPDDAGSIRSSTDMSVKEMNRRLAAALRERGINPTGAPWMRAKELLRQGASFAEAAEAVASVHSSAALETLVCESCGTKWSRVLTRGRKPRFCSDCRDGGV